MLQARLSRPDPGTAVLPVRRPVPLAVWLLLAASTAWGQAAPTPPANVPDAGSLLRESRQQPVAPPPLPSVQPPRLLQDTGVKVTVKRFDVSGATRFKASELEALLADLTGQELGFAQLQAAADRIATYYRKRGLHATAVLPEQTLDAGVVRIAVIEGRFGRLRVDASVPAGRRVPVELAQRMLAQGQTSGDLIDLPALERATMIANELPGLRLSALLAAGENAGETDVIAKMDVRPYFAGSLTLDNQDARATGELRAGVTMALAGPGGFGDEAQLTANKTEGKGYVRAAYAVPLGLSGLRGTLNTSYLRYKLVGEFAPTEARGSARTVGATLALPLLRGAESNVYASATADHAALVNNSLAGNLSDKRVDTLTLGVNGDTSDAIGGGGVFIAGANLSAGRLDLGGNAADLAADAAGPQRNGHFSKLALNAARLQRVSGSGTLWLTLAGQVAFNNLDSGQKFSLGGPSGVRAYPALEGSGDHGAVATVEYRHRVADTVQLNAFYDHGWLRRDKNAYAGSATPGSYALKGAGIGFEAQVPGDITVRGSVAQRIGSNPAADARGRDGDGTRRTPRLWLAASLPF